MKRITNILKSNEGSVLGFVLIIFLVISILTVSIIQINMSNTREVAAQENSLRAYYLAYSGIEIGYAVFTKDNDLLNEIKLASTHSKSTTIKYGDNDMDDILIEIIYDPNDESVKFISTGIHNASNSSSTLTMSYPLNNPSLRTWK